MALVKPSAIRELLKFGTDPAIISFGGGFPDPEIFPIEQLRKVYDHVILNEGKKALQYSNSEGILELREKLVKRVKASGVDCQLENLIVIQGGQQGLDLMAKMFINPGDVIIVENPTFVGGLIAFNPYEPVIENVKMDENGMVMEDLERILKSNKRVKFIYTIPEFQNPTGVTMPLERRKQLIELANKYDVMILEDSPYREIRYEGEPIVPIKSLDTENRVVHLGSFSKILSPGMRLGWLVAEKELATKFVQLKMAADTQNSSVNMYAANTYMELYDIDQHIELLRKAYKAKKDLMLDTIRQTFPDNVSYTDPDGGLFTWLTFPESWDAGKIMNERAIPEAKVAYVPGEAFYGKDPEKNHCRVNYSCMSEEKIVKGITGLGKIFKTL